MTTFMKTFSVGSSPGGMFKLGDNLVSAKGAFNFVFQATDGNLVLSVFDDASGGFDPIWQAGLSNPAALSPSALPVSQQPFCVMQGDGNFVYYVPDPKAASGKVARWATGTNGNPGAFLRCQDDGNLVVVSLSGAPLWATNTYAGTANRPAAGKV